MTDSKYTDWGEASEAFDQIKAYIAERDLTQECEAQTRFDVIDRIVRDVLGWHYGQITVEEHVEGKKRGFVDYILRQGDNLIVIESKRAGASFPSPTKRPKLKISGSVLGEGEIAQALAQAEEYGISKQANIVIVTNGLCWCFYSMLDEDDDSYASLLFPFTARGHAEQLFNNFAVSSVESGSLTRITNKLPPVEDRLLSAFKYADARVDRNNIADFILPALNSALYADALLSSPEHLRKCYVATEARTKFDTMLGMHLADSKPVGVKPAKRIKRAKEHGHLEQIVETSVPCYAPPVTLIIGPVGVGKSTYLRHFELIAARRLLDERKAHWIYIDFRQMGRTENPRKFLYGNLQQYLLAEHPGNPVTYKSTIEPAYANEIAALARGPYSLIFVSDKAEFNRRVTDYIEKEFNQVEPYVDKVMQYISKSNLCVVVLDNVDLYEDEALETNVFTEGLALSKRICCNVIVSMRDTTFVRHQADSTFNAFELRKLWLDPPPFKAVLSSRLSYSKKILKNKSAKLVMANGIQLVVPDLSVFFEIVQRSILYDQAGDYIDALADQNIRRGITLVANFLTSGHVNGDRAIHIFLGGDRTYRFPFHEVFKGTMLGQWYHFREDRTDGVNVFDARLGARQTRLLRLMLLNYLLARAQHEETVETRVDECIELFSKCGASENQIVTCLTFLSRKALVKSVTAEEIGSAATIILARSGGYYAKILSRKHVYVEECMFDTAIEDPAVWHTLSELTTAIEGQPSVVERWRLRRDRTECFLNYLSQLENESLALLGPVSHLASMSQIKESALQDATVAIAKSIRRHSD